MTPEHAWFFVEGRSNLALATEIAAPPPPPAGSPDENQARVRTAVENGPCISPQITPPPSDPHLPILLATGARSRDVPLERTLFPLVQARSLVSGMQSFQIQLGASTQPGWERWLRAMGSMTPTQ